MTRVFGLSAALVWSLTFAVSSIWAADKKLSRSDISPDMVSTSNPSKASFNSSALHRIDFIVKGSSCAACLLKIQKRLEKSGGVVQAGVMLTKPYGGVCVYDSSKINKEKLLLAAKGDEQRVSFEQIEDVAIPKMPLVLIPHHANDK